MQFRDSFQAEGLSRKSSVKFEKAGFSLLIAYVIAGVIYSAVTAPAARFPDEYDYLKLSANLLHGPGFSMDGVHLTACRPPGYAFFLYVLRAVGGGFFVFRIIQFLLIALTIFLVSRINPKGKAPAMILVITSLVICYPILFYTGATLYPQTLAGFLFVLSLFLALAQSRSLVLNLLAGISFGALILTVPTFLFTMAIVLAGAFFLKIVPWQDAVVIAFGAFIVIAAWTARNALVLHHFVPVATNSGLNFLAGNNEKSVADQGAAVEGMVPYYQEVANRGWDEFQADSYYRNVAFTYIRTHPGQASLHYLERVLNFFNITNAYATQNQEELSSWKQGVQAISYAFLLALLGWRLSAIRRFPLLPHEKLFIAVYLLSAFTSAIFLTRIRLRLPYDYLIIAVVALDLSRRFEIWIAAGRWANRTSNPPPRNTLNRPRE